MIWCIKTYIIAYVKTQKNKIHYPLCQTYSKHITAETFYMSSVIPCGNLHWQQAISQKYATKDSPCLSQWNKNQLNTYSCLICYISYLISIWLSKHNILFCRLTWWHICRYSVGVLYASLTLKQLSHFFQNVILFSGVVHDKWSILVLNWSNIINIFSEL